MTKKTIGETKQTVVKQETVETPKIDSEFARLLEIYKAQNPKKYALKEAELTRKLQANK
jgi:hypothetical protein